jgi:hypothetical protein
VVLVNNAGGGIFSFLPIAEALPEEVFTPLWATPQHVDLEGACRAVLCHAVGAMHALCCDVLPLLPAWWTDFKACPASFPTSVSCLLPPCRHVPRARHPTPEGGSPGGPAHRPAFGVEQQQALR